MSSCKTSAELKTSDFYRYHHSTKHTVESLYSSGHRLDWSSQPNPFLHFEGARTIDLPHEFEVASMDLFETIASLSAGMKNNQSAKLQSLSQGFIFLSNLLFYGMAISAWKQVVGTTNRWALRVNASSGNLHPTDTYVMTRDEVDGLKPGLYHYRVDEHKLEERTSGDLVTPLVKYLNLNCPPPPGVLCLSSVFFREAWKYRDRGFRYCQHDLGHALGALSVSAAALGWTTRVVSLFPDREVSEFLGMAGWEEKPLAFMLLAPVEDKFFPAHEQIGSLVKRKDISTDVQNEQLEPISEFYGEPNRLTTRMVKYNSIDEVYKATVYDRKRFLSAGGTSTREKPSTPGPIVSAKRALQIEKEITKASEDCLHKSVHVTIRRRRSAVDMDGKTGMSRRHLEYILRSATLGFAADFEGVDEIVDGNWRSASNDHLIQLYLYVHRVEGVTPGLYFFDRFENQLIPLLESDQKEVAMSTSCFQEIAADGAFSVSMIADFARGFQLYGDRCYRLAHYEAGYIGQLLYLAGCALGHDATGIGCFVDDAINNYLALDHGHEVIYNFTFGKAVHDPRLTTLPSYDFPCPDLS